ncbi:MAG: hypothetical protein JXQ81_11105 [Desulfuromonadales bacterium]|nr:hypothetical protein [Desulfuromonadales bacterium]
MNPIVLNVIPAPLVVILGETGIHTPVIPEIRYRESRGVALKGRGSPIESFGDDGLV